MKPLWWYFAYIVYWISYVLGIDRKLHPATDLKAEHV